MRRLSPLLLCLLLPLPALAQGAGGVVTFGPDALVVVRESDCRLLSRHKPRADVAYQPGQGAGGRKVKPADLNGGDYGIDLPEVVSFDISINPVGRAERMAANREKAQASQAILDNDAAEKAATAKQPKLTEQKTKLQDSRTSLDGEKAQFDAARTAAVNDIIAATGGAGETDPFRLQSRQNRIDVYDHHRSLDPAYRDYQSRRASNDAALTQIDKDIAANNKVISDAPAAKSAQELKITGAEGKLAGQSARGLDEVTMSVGTVAYNLKTGEMTFNGKPMTGGQEQALRAACAQRAVR